MEATHTRPVLIRHNTGLAASNLSKSYRKRPIVRNVSLNVECGEAVGLLGLNGAGKTTCFHIITGLVAADTGSITLDGHDVTGLPMYRRARLGIGYLPQEASIFRGLSVEANIRAVLEVVEEGYEAREIMLDSLLAEFLDLASAPCARTRTFGWRKAAGRDRARPGIETDHHAAR